MKIVRAKEKVFSCSYCSIRGKLGRYLKPPDHMILERERESEEEGVVGSGFARLGGHS